MPRTCFVNEEGATDIDVGQLTGYEISVVHLGVLDIGPNLLAFMGRH